MHIINKSDKEEEIEKKKKPHQLLQNKIQCAKIVSHPKSLIHSEMIYMSPLKISQVKSDQ